MEFRKSSAIWATQHDPGALTLHITFTSGRTYTYFNVPQWKYQSLISASSAGEYFNAQIRDQHSMRAR